MVCSFSLTESSYLGETEEEGKPAEDDENLAHGVSDLGLASLTLSALALERAQLTTVDLVAVAKVSWIIIHLKIKSTTTTHIRTVGAALEVTVVEATAVELFLRLLALFA